MGMREAVAPAMTIAESEFEITYARSSGPGGQNVNKVNSKAIVRWNVVQSPSLPDAVRTRFLARYGSRLTADGALVIMSDRFRDQLRNREDCLAKIAELVRSVAVPPRVRRKTRPSRSSVEKRHESKSRRGGIKRLRGRVRGDE